jgi:hypothetical protein
MRNTCKIALATALLVACNGDSTGPQRVDSIADLAGSWSVIGWEYSLAADTTQKTDWVDTEDLNGTLHIQSSGAFAVLVEFPWGWGRDYGEMTIEDGTIYWDGEGDEEYVPFELAGGVLTARWPEEDFVDVDRDGEPEYAWLKMSFQRINTPTIGQVAGSYSATTFRVEIGTAFIDILGLGGFIDIVLNADGTTSGTLSIPDMGGGGSAVEEDLAGWWYFYGTHLELEHPAYTVLRDMVFSVETGRFFGVEELGGEIVTVVFEK